MTSKSHYEAHTAASYESAFFYEEGAYTENLAKLVMDGLCLKEGSKPRTLLDIGGGTGNFTRMLTNQSEGIRAIVVDPFLPESSTKEGSDDVQYVKASAEEFTKDNFEASQEWWRNGYSQVLLKEVVHHFAHTDRKEIFRGMLNGLVTDNISEQPNIPSLLIITRPQRDIDYPLWNDARDVWAKNQPHVDDIMNDLTAAGFRKVQYKVEPYPCEISLARWQSMVKQRFWSTFANFSDAELDAACKLIAEAEAKRVDSKGIIQFEDRLLFIEAHR
ncbi:Methyltransferase [Seminavis robusta]|uniref:Methyltransferase n=1 Tax=Seminavis robusta TaxID=568900 RepID=A0A9N8DRR4_9STRA|nr:Methyltransferase [Seminavis robusta]|eukprot:Sro323_g117270.1 Methyltransferase (274) ;mRNA; r:19142-19963